MPIKSKRLEYFKIYYLDHAYAIYRNDKKIGVVFRWGKRWCSTDFKPFDSCRTRYEAAFKLGEMKK